MKSLEQLRRDAKALKTSHAAGEPEAQRRLAAHPPGTNGPLKHADYLHVIAQEQGFASWPRLKQAVETTGFDRAQQVQHLKIALHHGQNAVVERLLEQAPDLAEGLFGLQVALLNRSEVARMLEEDPSRATQLFGPRRPLLHLAFSRWIHARPDREGDMLAIGEMLLAHGADVNDSCPVDPDNDHPLSALYGAIGHADNMVLGRWLLERGADPNDGESLYHSTELGHHDGLRMLLAHGADPKGTNALLRAMDFNDHEAVELLLSHGADPNEFASDPVGGELPWVIPALHQAARRRSDPRMIALLLDAGADPARRFQGCSAYGYARVFGNRALAEALDRKGDLPELSREERLLAAAADGEETTGSFIDPARLPDAYRDIVRTILHLPNVLDHLDRLAALGIETDRPDGEGLTPVQVAGWEGLPEVMAWCLKQMPDLSHVNGYGGTLLSTIVHGSENCPARQERDHIACARMALERGVALPRPMLNAVGEPELAAFLTEWAEARPGQVTPG